MAIGNPVSTTSSSVASKTSSVIATAGQTLFTVPAGYVTNHISVFRNGIRLVDGRDYEARNGATVTLLAAATVGDVIEFHVFDTFSVADAVTNQGGTIFGDLTVEGSIGNITGVAATFTGAVSVGGVLTYEDVTNIDSVGIITARSDLSIADKIIHTGDTNTAIRFPAADTVTAETSGSERLRITSDGKIGINQSTPQTTFHSTGTTNGQQATFGIDDSGLKISTFQKTDNDAGVILDAQKSSNGTLTFATTGTERLRITSGGEVTIGTNAPPASAKLTVRAANAEISAYSSAGGSSKLSLGDTNDHDDGSIRYVNGSGYQYMLFSTAGSERLRITSGGNLSLGNSSVAFPTGSGLQVYHASSPRIKLTNSTTGVGSGDGSYLYVSGSDFLIENKESANMRFYTAATERMRIDGAGRMALGTTSTVNIGSGYEGLTINASTAGTLYLQGGGTSGGRILSDGSHLYIGPVQSSGSTIIQRAHGANETARFDSSGNMGLGTASPSSLGTNITTLEIQGAATTRSGGIRLSTSNNSQKAAFYVYDGAGIVGTETAHPFGIYTNNAERMRIDSAGKLVVGATSFNSAANAYTQVMTSGSQGGIIINSTDTSSSSYGRLLFTPNGHLSGNEGLIRYNNGDYHMAFYTQGAERMRITSSGQMGLGTNNPVQQSGKGLHIHNSGGQTRIKLTNNVTGATANDGFDIIQEHNNDVHILNHEAGVLKFGTNDAERMRIDANGLVGINMTPANTASNTYPLQIYSPGTQCFLTLGNSNTGSGPSNGLVLGNDGSSAYIWNRENTPIQFATNNTERLRIDSSGNMSLGSSTINLTAAARTTLSLNGTNSSLLAFNYSDTISGYFYAEATEFRMEANGTRPIVFRSNSATRMVIDSSGNLNLKNSLIFQESNTNAWSIYTNGANGYLRFYDEHNSAERLRIDNSGRLLVGTTSSSSNTRAVFQGNSAGSTGAGVVQIARGSNYTTTNTNVGNLEFTNLSGNIVARINCTSDGTSGGVNGYPGSLTFQTESAGSDNGPEEKMRITNSGRIYANSTVNSGFIAGNTDYFSIGSSTETGHYMRAGNEPAAHVRSSGIPLYIGRQGSDGKILAFYQAGTEEGSFVVNGTTVTFNGAHLSRWSQLPGGAERTEILRGSVLSNLDEMCEWGEEDNEQLNRTKVSDVEGDRNVAGVFQSWDDDDDTYTNDFYCAMTGDFVIRIAQGTTVARGDLLMSAGDGTAKPQDDDIVRSKTIAKVTSTTVSTTYSDGSYCVPCVLMAC